MTNPWHQHLPLSLKMRWTLLLMETCWIIIFRIFMMGLSDILSDKNIICKYCNFMLSCYFSFTFPLVKARFFCFNYAFHFCKSLLFLFGCLWESSARILKVKMPLYCRLLCDFLSLFDTTTVSRL